MSVDHYENFPVASWLCPPQLRGAIRAIYHYARCADDLADEGRADAAMRLASLERYRAALEAALRNETSPDIEPAWAAIFDDLRTAVVRHRLPAQPLRDLLSAFEQDVHNPIYDDRAALLDYCSRSADPVGRLLLHLYGIEDARSARQSDAVCTALQLVNFWQDLSVDLPRGRAYVTTSDLSRHGTSLEELGTGDSPRSRALIADLCNWARGLMLEGAPLVHRIPGRAGWELRGVVQGGLRILDKIAALDHAVLRRRPSLRGPDVATIAWRSLWMRPRAHVAPSASDLAR